jgi:SNF2 family DNA or RNA helicase
MSNPKDDPQKTQKIYEQVLKVRESTTVKLHPTKMFRQSIVGFDGNPQEFNLRYYQAQGIFHLLVVPRMVLGDATGCGKTIQAIGALCYLWEKDPSIKPIVVCPKSAIYQWASEIDKFTIGIKYFMIEGTPTKRIKTYQEWVNCKEFSILIVNYHSIMKDWDYNIEKEEAAGDQVGSQPVTGKGFLDGMTFRIPGLTVIYDECTAFKNASTKTHKTCKQLSQRARRVWGLTATLLKNNLLEGFGIYKVIRPETFKSKYAFMDAYCITELQRIKGGVKIPIVVGYKNLEHFRKTIDPFFYGRPKHIISKELPQLITRDIICELSASEEKKYSEALSGIFELGDGEIKDYADTKQLTSLIYAQEVCDSLGILKFEEGQTFEGRSSKETALVDLLTEEFDGEKVIVYTRFEKLVSRLQGILAHKGIKNVAITGKTTDRKLAQEQFQNLNSEVSVIFITDAGSEAINLQAASAMIFIDTPWSWGNYVQCLGRMIRIGSPHQNVLALHLMAVRPLKNKSRETIDHKVIQKLRKKKGLIDQVIGEAAIGALRFEHNESDIKELINSLREDMG